MKIKIDITKRLLAQVALIVAIVGAAVVLDVYFENNPTELKTIGAEKETNTSDCGEVFMLAQSATSTVKTSVQKSSPRKLQVQLHDKFLRKYHQIRNYEVLKAEVQTQTAPIIQSYHYLIFQNFFFTQPDEDSIA